MRSFTVAIGLCSAIGLTLELSSTAQALSLTGTSSGQFGLPASSAPSIVVSLSNEAGGTNNRLTWGTPVPGSFSNFVQFDGAAFSTTSGSVFNLGSLTYRNGTTDADSTFDGDFPLSIGLNFTAPAGINKTFSFLFNILNTPNTGDSIANADRLRFSTAGLTTDTFSVDGINYTLRLLGFSTNGGATIVNEFLSPEESTAQANLYGEITTEVIPTPALLPALIGFGLGAWRKQQTQSEESEQES
jgi:hypothetical protein